MNIADTVKEIHRRTPLPPIRRAGYGAWVTAAWEVRALVEKDWNVSDAVRAVVEAHNYHPPDRSFRSIRAAYYVIRTKPAPKQ